MAEEVASIAYRHIARLLVLVAHSVLSGLMLDLLQVSTYCWLEAQLPHVAHLGLQLARCHWFVEGMGQAYRDHGIEYTANKLPKKFVEERQVALEQEIAQHQMVVAVLLEVMETVLAVWAGALVEVGSWVSPRRIA